jgi:hypothetical protein
MAAERKKACCLISEFPRRQGSTGRTSTVRRQVLEGVMLFCQWRLERMERPRPAGPSGRKVEVE